MHVNQSEVADFILLHHSVKQELQSGAMDLAVNYLQLKKLLGNPLHKKRLQSLNGSWVKLIVLVNYRLEVLYFGKTRQDYREFVSIKTTVIEEDSVDELMVSKLASFSDTLTHPITEDVVLQAEGLFVNFLEDG